MLRGKHVGLLQLVLVVAPAFILFGYNQSNVGGLLSVHDWAQTFPEIDTLMTKGAQKKHNSTIQGVVVASFVLGALVGALSCSWIGDKLGRRRTIFLGATLTLLGEVLECSSFQLAQLVVGRTILGCGVGALSAVVPVWQSETSSSSKRGQHVVLDGLFICIGYVLQAWINLGFYQIKHGPLSWRLPLALPSIVSILLMGSIWLFPESPRWLAAKGRTQEARRNLAISRNAVEDDPQVVSEMHAIEHSLELNSKHASRLRDIFTSREDKLFYRFMLCIVLQFFQQMTGGNLISVYSTVIFQQGLQLDSQTSRILSGGTLTWKFVSSFVAFFTVERFGRRKLFMFSGGGMALCMMALATATSFPKTNQSAQIASVFFVYLFNFFIPIGFLGANFLYCTEVAPTHLRVKMASISTANHWLWNFVVTMITPVAIESIGYQYYIVFTCIGICVPLSVYWFYPETQGRTLEEMDVLFRDQGSMRAVVRASCPFSRSVVSRDRGSNELLV
ncbi:hypothetical protein M409DRAFT_63459 [Zasmidium cellare ATCC 36951]|uniref:Major facilitator superfamily (MFS) profile domain-containing protein n=1 Tax=Zasmidium cellare ATCC 36951 TaxID=1080233 RepID=A0A6A6CXT0_ZASCE|nr:uncharacterized protein M409DRAFT_63459 [Zasmidium cellare ATCC 36951]KAF2171921.1 hypothetical protein M409DRAFT_63459 [Zasmidium cellare ATCC 36951]